VVVGGRSKFLTTKCYGDSMHKLWKLKAVGHKEEELEVVLFCTLCKNIFVTPEWSIRIKKRKRKTKRLARGFQIWSNSSEK
jgi:hypothetical protein